MMNQYTVTVNGIAYEITVEPKNSSRTVAPAAVHPYAPVSAPITPAPIADSAISSTAAPAAVSTPTPAPAANGSGTVMNAPMPGTILDVSVSVGQKVSNGDVLFILEAMKMENEIFAPCSGTISAVGVKKGDVINPGDHMCTIE